jgi:hypothetical protein
LSLLPKKKKKKKKKKVWWDQRCLVDGEWEDFFLYYCAREEKRRINRRWRWRWRGGERWYDRGLLWLRFFALLSVEGYCLCFFFSFFLSFFFFFSFLLWG